MRAIRLLAKRDLPAGYLLVLLALVLRFAVPAGFMLSAEGGLAVVPCPTVLPALSQPVHAGDAHAHAGHHSHAPTSDEHAKDDRPCPFGILAASGLAPEQAPALLERIQQAPGPALAIPERIFARLLAAPPPPSQGPPRLS